MLHKLLLKYKIIGYREIIHKIVIFMCNFPYLLHILLTKIGYDAKMKLSFKLESEGMLWREKSNIKQNKEVI